jgi:hypothetical protein
LLTQLLFQLPHERDGIGARDAVGARDRIPLRLRWSHLSLRGGRQNNAERAEDKASSHLKNPFFLVSDIRSPKRFVRRTVVPLVESGSRVEGVLRLSEGRCPRSRRGLSQRGELLFTLGQPGEYRLKRFNRDLRGGIRRGQETARRARRTIGGVVGVMRTRAIRLDMRAGIRAESPFGQRRQCQHQLSGDQETNRRPPDWRWKNADVTTEVHAS